MKQMLDAFWRAAAYCLHPRVIGLSLLPLVVVALTGLVLGYFFWEPALTWMREFLYQRDWLRPLWAGLDRLGLSALKTVVPALVVIAAITPLLVLATLFMVSVAMTPVMVQHVQQRRFAHLTRKHGASLLASVSWSVGSTLLALAAFVLTVPLWLVPPLILVLPPLIWGWLAYRVFTFDVLANHASQQERTELFARHRHTLLGMGVVCGFMGAAPSVVWASGALFAALFVLLIPVAVWIYTLVFVFSSLWFAHYALAALAALRQERGEAGTASDLPNATKKIVDAAVTTPILTDLTQKPR